MIRHLVIINFFKKYKKDFRALLEATRPHVAKIPGILEYRIYGNGSRYVPDGIESFGVEIHFGSKEDLDVFMKHPAHFEANAIFEEYLADPPFMVLTHAQ